MAFINENYLKLQKLSFCRYCTKVAAFKEKEPSMQIIRLGIGDVTQPLAPAVIQAMHQAVDEMSDKQTFRGYGPEQGYDFLRKAIVHHDFEAKGIQIDIDEIFINDGAKVTQEISPIFSDKKTLFVLRIPYTRSTLTQTLWEAEPENG